MPPEPHAPNGAFSPKHKLWVERDGRVAMSDYRLRLLEAIEASGSLVRAAAEMGLSYRRAWGKIKDLESTLGIALLSSQAGGKRGGESRLTPEAMALVAAYRRFQERVAEAVDAAYAAEFGQITGIRDDG